MHDDRATWTAAWHLFPGAIAYVWHAGLKASTVAADLEAAGFTLRNQIIWAKQHFALSRGDYHWGHEPRTVPELDRVRRDLGPVI